MKFSRLVPLLLLLPAQVALSRPTRSDPTLQINFGPEGLERLIYRGQTLADVNRWPSDRFHIWHMKAFDLAGREQTGAGYGWGENNLGRHWNGVSKTWTYRFKWGELAVRYVQHGDVLDVETTATNKVDSGIIFDGATVYPLTLHPQGNTVVPGDARIGDGLEAPNVTSGDLGKGQTVMISSDANKPIWSGYQVTREKGISTFMSGTLPDGLRAERKGPGFFALSPGKTATFRLTLEFHPTADLDGRALDALATYRSRWPERLTWKDRRLIGTVYLASSGEGDKQHSSRTPNNPRRYLAGGDVEMRSPEGLKEFQTGILEQAQTIVRNLRRMNAQGAITWDIEGQEYPHNTSYVCAPDSIARTAPEMESVVTNPNSKYVGLKLDDAYFRTIKDAGFRVGVCVRPQRFVQKPDGSATQSPLSDTDAATELIRKMKYAHDRWGATLFYADSTVRVDGSPLKAETLEAIAASLPDSLVIPEEATMRSYRAMAPLQSLLSREDSGTSASVLAIYPRAFSANLINDVDAAKLEAHQRELVQAVRTGDILMIHADYWQQNNLAVTEIYQKARRQR